MRFVDPDGMEVGKYYNESGQEIFDDKKDDHKIYVIKTTKTTEQMYDSRDNDPGKANPITEQEAASTEKEIKSGNLTGSHMKNVAYVGTEGQMDKMLDNINDNGTRGTLDQNNREYGGVNKKNGDVENAPPGPVLDPSNPKSASLSLKISSGEGTNHSHPSGTKGVYGWGARLQPPSGQDIRTSNSSQSYVFGMRSYTLFLYNKDGVYGTMPLQPFIK